VNVRVTSPRRWRLWRRRATGCAVTPHGLAAALAAALVSSLLGTAATARVEATGCRVGISRDTTERLFAVLNHPPTETECKFEGVETTRTSLEARWSRSGTPLPPVRVVPRECAPDDAQLTGPFRIQVPRDIALSCPSVVPLIAEFERQIAAETTVRENGILHDPLFRGAQVLFVGIFIVAVGLLIRGAARFRSCDARWIVLGIASFAAALALRAALPFSLGNWYSEVLPAFGPPPWMRFGPGYFAFQSLLRDAGVWGPRALIVSQLLIGAAAVPLLLGVLRELDVGLEATAATLVLLVFAPFHARLSATASEHVLASTLCLALLLAWLRAARTGDWIWFGLTVLLFPAVCATRVDMAIQASLALLWPLLRDRAERRSGLRGWPLFWRVAVVGLMAAATLAATYQFIALPSHHPMPDATGRLFVLRGFIPQYWLLATSDPGWISLPAVLLAIVGVVAMAVRRPLLLARVAGTLLVAFVALGRSFIPDELLGARYFLFTIPVFLMASGQGFEALLALVPRRVRGVAAAAGIVLLGLWSGLAARGAYEVRYAFQDEYTFARRALAQLPDHCAVYQIPMRPDAFPRDLDCCLDVRRSPLVLDFPQLQFLDLPDNPVAVFKDASCVAYYEGVACEIRDDPNDPAVHDRADKAADYLHQRCAEVRRVGRFAPLAETTTSPRATVNFFHGTRPRAGLYRWMP
jgi:hypothetical protein